MTEQVFELLEEFAARRARGERPDPLDFLPRAGDDADQLAARIDRLVQALPPPSPAPDDIARMRALIDGEPPLLSLRLARRLRLQDVAEALAAALGLPAAATARVRARYHELEAGLLDLRGLDRRVRTALADVLGVVEERLSAAQAPPPGGGDAARIARSAPPDRARFAPAMMLPASEVVPDESRGRPDVDAEVDRLFGAG